MTDTATTQQFNQLANEVQGLSGHSIMLVQFSKNEETRTYLDCQSPNEMLETFCRIYENFLLNKLGIINNPSDSDPNRMEVDGKREVEYQLEDILKFVDQLFDLSAMVFNHKAAGYTCHGKAWFKAMLHVYLRKMAQ